jgi:hypothetical protein
LSPDLCGFLEKNPVQKHPHQALPLLAAPLLVMVFRKNKNIPPQEQKASRPPILPDTQSRDEFPFSSRCGRFARRRISGL